jgi:hypothetical protein
MFSLVRSIILIVFFLGVGATNYSVYSISDPEVELSSLFTFIGEIVQAKFGLVVVR